MALLALTFVTTQYVPMTTQKQSMRAVVFADGALGVVERAVPTAPAGEALIRVRLAGICNTDVEIVRGYMGFAGVLGHEFVGEVVACDDAGWLGARVVGEINAGCGVCALCRAGDSRHCGARTVLGIVGRDGALAEYTLLPTRNLLRVPDRVSDEMAVFCEPLAAACGIAEQVELHAGMRALVLGDGKLGLLVAQVLVAQGCDVVVLGQSAPKLELARALGLAAHADTTALAPRYDLVVEATGQAQGLQTAIARTRPRGTLVLKSTYAGTVELNAAPLVVDEITIVGSRCGPFAPALQLLEQSAVQTAPLISGRFVLGEALAAFAAAQRPDALKILVDMPA